MPNRPYILTRRGLNPSARILARELGLQKSFEPRSYPPVIRWGNSDPLPIITTAPETQLNHRYVIETCANKLRFSRDMTSLGIPHVEVRTGIPERFPVVIRHTLSGTRGAGIEIVTNHEDLEETEGESIQEAWDGVYWTYWRNFSFELGVHFFEGQILRIFKKVAREGTPQEEFPIKNMSRGWGFSLVSPERYKRLVPLVIEFCEKFGMMFGRLDIGWNGVEKKYEIIEANSAPGIAENSHTAELYVENFKRLLNI